ncbi:LexA family transcriptional regulator [Thermus thalpophilus]|uniref:LexA family transcriptional regulator n=1 Tax=Thermus thalpophilus TaxID=2908147 RepID=UPI00311A9768
MAVKRGAETLLEKPSWGQAIKARRQALGLTQEDIEAATQDAISQKTVSDLEVGRVHPLKLGAEKFLALLSALRWTPEEFAQATGLEVPLVYRPSGEPREDVVWLTVVASGTAGRPWPEAGVLPVPKEFVRPGSMLIRVEGDSMDTGDDDGLRDGDLVLVDQNLRDLRPGKVFALEILGDGITIKRARKTKRGWVFVSDNPAGPVLEPDEVNVLGEVYRKISIREVK